jgi:hypothetical protein
MKETTNKIISFIIMVFCFEKNKSQTRKLPNMGTPMVLPNMGTPMVQ